MAGRRTSVLIAGAVAATVALLMAVPAAAGGRAGTASVVYSFAGDEDGEYPSTELVRDASGNLYGTTVQGGDLGGGTVFRLSPSAAGDGWTHAVLYSFTGGADGGQPYGGVALGAHGELYGTAVIGGTGGVCAEDGCGVVYELTPTSGGWSEHVLYDFTGGSDGSGPGSGLTVEGGGNLFGMTPTGGAYGLGTIFELSPHLDGIWRFKVIHAFTGGSDGGAASAGRLLLDDAGNLFGVATIGGANGQGVAFELLRAPSGRWKLKTLYQFGGEPDAGFPYGGLVADAAGNLYGTSYYDGANGLGAAYRLAFRNGAWTETVLYSFDGGSDGADPISTLVFDSAGNLYGTTSEGGAPGCSCGTIFQLAPSGNGRWTESVAYAFTGVPDGAFAYNGMVADGSGNFFGTTVHGGADNEGAIYTFTP